MAYYNENCSIQTCSQGCCNFLRNCPDYSSPSSNENQCWYYYTYTTPPACNSASSTGSGCCYSATKGYYICNNSNNSKSLGSSTIAAIVGGVIGGIAVLAIIVIVLIVLCKKMRQSPTSINPQQGSNSTIMILPPGTNPQFSGYMYPPTQNLGNIAMQETGHPQKIIIHN